MATRAGLFGSWQDAERAALELERRGFARDKLKLVARDNASSRAAARRTAPRRGMTPEGAKIATHAGVVATGGAAICGMVGALAGLSAFTVPGLGPILSDGASWYVFGPAAAGIGVGAAAGGLIGALYGMGVVEEDAVVHARSVRHGGVLLSVETDETRAAEAEEVLRAAGAADPGGRYAGGEGEIVTSDKDPATIIGDYPPHEETNR